MKNYNLIGVLLGVIAVFFVGVVLLELRSVLIPFVVALLLSIIFKPIVQHLRQRRLPTAVALVAVLLTFFLVVFLVGWTLYTSTATMAGELPRYEERIGRMFDNMERFIDERAAAMNIDVGEISLEDTVDVTAVRAALTSGVGSFLSFMGSMFLVLLFMMFILAGSGDLAEKVRHAFPADHADRIARVIANVDSQVRRYLVTKTVVSLGTGILSFLVLLILGVDFPLVWGFLAFVLNYIPNLGSIVAVMFPVFLSALQFESFGIGILVLGLLVSCQTLMANIVEPRMMGFSLNLSPLLILVSLIFWGWLWGTWGMVLAVPLTSAIKILFENVEPLHPLSVLMSQSSPGSLQG
jgi:predicted PurR-regulated permease PerM